MAKIKGSPKPYSNGRHNVAKVAGFCKKTRFKRVGLSEDEDLKTRKLLAEVKQAEIKLKVMEGTYVAIEKVREVWTAHIGQVRQILESRFLNKLPPILTTLDAIQIPGEIAGGTRRDLQGNLYRRRLDKRACRY